eukprot:scaffold52988_cov68-Phaeocystis_antarctica.AAC.6
MRSSLSSCAISGNISSDLNSRSRRATYLAGALALNSRSGAGSSRQDAHFLYLVAPLLFNSRATHNRTPGY